MNGSQRRKARARRCAREREWKATPSIGLDLGQRKHKGDSLVPVKGKLRQQLTGEKRERRNSQFEHGIVMACAGVKVRRKTGPSGSKHYKTWLRKGEA